MKINELLNLLNISDEEKERAKEKNLATFALVSEEEVKEIIEMFNANNVTVTKASQIKVFANSPKEIKQRIDLIKSECPDLMPLVQADVLLLNSNAMKLINNYKQLKRKGAEITSKNARSLLRGGVMMDAPKKEIKEVTTETKKETVEPVIDEKYTSSMYPEVETEVRKEGIVLEENNDLEDDKPLDEKFLDDLTMQLNSIEDELKQGMNEEYEMVGEEFGGRGRAA